MRDNGLGGPDSPRGTEIAGALGIRLESGNPAPPESFCYVLNAPGRGLTVTYRAKAPTVAWSVMQNRLVRAGLLGLRERSVQVSGQQPQQVRCITRTFA